MPLACTISLPNFPEGFDRVDGYRSYGALLTWQVQGVLARDGRVAPLERASVRAVLQRPRGQPMLDNEFAESSVRQLLGALQGILITGDITLVVAQQLSDRRGVILEVTELLV